MLPTQTLSSISNTLGTGHTSDGLMEEFRRCESEFKNGDETVQFKIAHSVLTILTSEPTQMKKRSSIGIRSGLLERFSERLSSDCASTLSGVLSSVIVVMVTSVSEGRPQLRSDLIPSLLALSSHSKSTDKKNEEWKEDSFSLTRRCGFALSRIEKAVLTFGQSLENDQNDENTRKVQNEAGGIVFRHFRSSIQSPSEKEIGSIGIDLASVRREMEQERERVKREMDDKMKQMETEREKEKKEIETEREIQRKEREKEKETAKKAEEERQREFSRKMREMEEMNEKWIEEGRQREEEKKREEERKRGEERKRQEEEERRRNVKEGAAAIEVFQQDKFTLAGSVFTKTGTSNHHLLSHSFGAVVVRITFIIRSIGGEFHFGLLSTDLTERVKTAECWFRLEKGGAGWCFHSKYLDSKQNSKESHKGSACKLGVVGQRVVMEADGRGGKRTLKLSQDGETQPVFFTNIPVPFRFTIQMLSTGCSVEIVSSEVLEEPSMVGGSFPVVMD
ncbi:hypothetical protein BLNAU_17489 [Blattamonas nauphoetae]|uniref:Uncharacterized protein n=1 Tax=Blattamonas nauphoetae TaxID=2049346 RepID=A0ABQ9X761_9EUKA|nr:hypothetical protein BLNAU_17489 [Blattamonas nauphoetae]